ncbi:hypothetical protein [Microbulbifer agarilyticus]|uniref:hypothetical protein n=1 Tax=Microbulbifer agarilyticus TaxID=260552 RepID=UPI0012F9EFCF|nr:hypothetical protein [Microbulbifer agarilyticus]
MIQGVDNTGLVALAKLCARLSRVHEFSFNASSGLGSKTDWRNHGRGEVEVSSYGAHSLFTEQMKRADKDVEGWDVALQHRYRWTRCVNFVRLEHLRDGWPCLLFDFTPATAHGFRHQNEHRYGEDIYTADLILHADEIELIWQIHGPQNNARLHYHYW